jgi:hypothetical protein
MATTTHPLAVNPAFVPCGPLTTTTQQQAGDVGFVAPPITGDPFILGTVIDKMREPQELEEWESKLNKQKQAKSDCSTRKRKAKQ